MHPDSSWQARSGGFDLTHFAVDWQAQHVTCPLRRECTRGPARHLSLHAQAFQETLHVARQRQTTPAFKTLDDQPSGIEATHSQAVRAFELRRSRYIGLAQTHLQPILTAMPIHLSRLAACWSHDHPAQTRPSAFAAVSCS